jgi:polyhydroxyalkanoate synthesis repressor PhaR
MNRLIVRSRARPKGISSLAPLFAPRKPPMVRSKASSTPTDSPEAEISTDALPNDAARVLKKYPNRRLYDSATSSYITLADVKKMVLAGTEFVVRDAKTGEDITRSILLQIILEEETGGAPMFTSQVLAQIIRFYGNAMQGLMGSYLEKNLQVFSEMQSRFADQAKGMYDPRLMSPEAWTKFLSGTAPHLGQSPGTVQDLMAGYMEQSKTALTQMQEQMSKQTQALFSGLSAFKPPKD